MEECGSHLTCIQLSEMLRFTRDITATEHNNIFARVNTQLLQLGQIMSDSRENTAQI